ncbi:HAD-IIIC family phosphatase [Polynucleobacter bastaniensis]|uniref:HAD-IIIC family phosphatase n=1 Tax=Polynucleobacter bastaniensis TaxID=2081039 RepID=UPI001C0C337F|nr:HAD-IIIC family phosphatase [Polynucleobacter bastaniensis]MBU3597328.1 HAD family hydrolase [Polynucleobacter bastaniensis]
MNDKTKSLQVELNKLSDERSMNAYSRVDNLLFDQPSSGLELLRIAAVRNFTIEPLIPVLRSEFALAGYFAEMYLGDYDTVSMDVLNSKSRLYDFNPNMLLMFFWLETLSPMLTLEFIRLSHEEVQLEIKRIIDEISNLIKNFRNNSTASILINNFPLNSYPTLGILDSQLEWGQTNSIIYLNKELLKIAKQNPNVYIVDYQLIFSRYGYRNVIDDRYWSVAKAPLKSDVITALAGEYSKYLKALKGKTKKCLVLDCDNTLWGGVIGEDGIKGIRIGENSTDSFCSFQTELLNLYHRGVILAICSKNNEIDVLDVLDNHPEMILKKSHFAAWQINWDDKASNIDKIAKKLNIGIDSFVFVDDSIFECEWVAQKLPEVAVLNLKGDASSYRRQLVEKAYFDGLTYTSEDKARTEMYLGALQSDELLSNSDDYSDYLKKLELKAEIGIPDDLMIARVSQLTQKTNQFNLTTKRYTEGDITRMIGSEDFDVFYLKLKDKFIDLGLIGIAITRRIDSELHIDSLLLSCRALGRGAEDVLIAYIIDRAKTLGCKKVIGMYVPSVKNAQVEDLFERQGFVRIDVEDASSSWVWNVEKEHEHVFNDWIELTKNG